MNSKQTINLNKELYAELWKKYNPEIQEMSALDNWYFLSRMAFQKQELNNKRDFLRHIAFAYSWMPTIPKIRLPEDSDLETLITDLQCLRSVQGIDESLDVDKWRCSLVFRLASVVNNSVVGASKIMHFVSNERVPILDSRVARAWDRIVTGTGLKLSNPSSLSLDKQVMRYVRYWRLMEEWLEVIPGKENNVTIRILEQLLFVAGKKE